jgi:hypothetical protein
MIEIKKVAINIIMYYLQYFLCTILDVRTSILVGNMQYYLQKLTFKQVLRFKLVEGSMQIEKN